MYCSVPRAKNKICRTETHRKTYSMSSVHFDATLRSICAIQILQNFQLYVNEELYIRYLSVKLIQLLAHPSSKPLHWCNQILYSDAWILDVTFSLKALHQILLKLPLVFIWTALGLCEKMLWNQTSKNIGLKRLNYNDSFSTIEQTVSYRK